MLSTERSSSETSSPETLSSEIPSPVNFTENAADKVSSLISDEGNDNLNLRVYISGGGCSGFQYGFTFDEERSDDDTVVEKKGVHLLIDPMSVQYLFGAKIDYLEDLQGARFVIENPNASTTCGCGSSFSV
jgi:iron-sulfur cluster insertion protein